MTRKDDGHRYPPPGFQPRAGCNCPGCTQVRREYEAVEAARRRTRRAEVLADVWLLVLLAVLLLLAGLLLAALFPGR